MKAFKIIFAVVLLISGFSRVAEAFYFSRSNFFSRRRLLFRSGQNEALKSEPLKVSSAQPFSGPGSARYRYSQVIAQRYGAGSDNEYYIFEPENANRALPLIVFNHGLWMGKNPKYYRAWIDHIVKRGNIVIFPVNKISLKIFSSDTSNNVIDSVKMAIKRLYDGTHTIPDLNKFAAMGHSIGALIAVNMAVLANTKGLPRPRAVMAVQPGNPFYVKVENLNAIPRGTLLLSIAAMEDYVVFDLYAKRIFNEATGLNKEDKNLIIIKSDYHGAQKLSADHFAPCSLKGFSDASRGYAIDALDYYGYWKLLDGLTDAAFYGKNREYALGNTFQQRYRGTWNDGEPIRELEIVTK